MNVRYGPDKSHSEYEPLKHSVSSDLDVLAYGPNDPDPLTRVLAVSCKAWQEGLSPTTFLNIFSGKTKGGSAMNRHTFKELLDPMWSEAFRAKIGGLTQQPEFTYVVAVTRLRRTAIRSRVLPSGWQCPRSSITYVAPRCGS